MIQQQEQAPKFQWFQCPLIIQLQRSEDDPPESQPQLISLKSQLSFYDSHNQQHPFSLIPQLQQDPLYDKEIGFNWHKSWLIPTLKLKSSLNTLSVSQQHLLKYYITSCYPIRQHETNYLKQIKLQGVSQRIFPTQTCPVTFNNLKFTTTSFKINGARLSLLVVVMLESSGVILTSKISSPIYIDSRKQARLKKTPNAEKIQNNKFNEQLYVFSNGQKIRVNNTIDDFIMYYSASNIRFKFKHPFYVCYKWNKCFRLYYNKRSVGREEEFGVDGVLQRVYEAIQKQQQGKIIIECEYLNFEAKKRVLSIFNNWRITFIQFVWNKEEIGEEYEMADWKALPGVFKLCLTQKLGKGKEKEKKEERERQKQRQKEKQKLKEKEKGKSDGPFKNFYRTEMVLSQPPPQPFQPLIIQSSINPNLVSTSIPFFSQFNHQQPH